MALAVLAAGCSSGDDAQEPSGADTVATSGGTAAGAPAATAAAEPKTVEAAKVAAQAEFDAYAAGDWAGAWDLYNAAGQAAISRADYVRLHTECKVITGPAFVIKSARLEGTDKAVVNVSRLNVLFSYTMTYEGGHWRYQPDDDAMRDYARGVDATIASEKADGTC